MVSNHPTLVSERALNLLANGYVKSIWGEPSTVAVIPVSEGGTGATDTGTARANLGLGNVSTANYNGSSAYYLRGDGVWATIPDQIPQNMLAMFWTGCPAGWARAPWWDGYFFRSAAAYTGTPLGATNHYHGAGALAIPAHGHAAAGLTLPDHGHGGWVTIAGSTNHTGDHVHYFDKNFSGETSVNVNGDMDVDAGNSGKMARGPHTHNFQGRVDGDTDTRGGHSHSVSGGGSIPTDGGHAINGSVTAAPAIAVVNTTDWATNHYPPFFDMIYCYKL
jgi:hypothetical protein